MAKHESAILHGVAAPLREMTEPALENRVWYSVAYDKTIHKTVLYGGIAGNVMRDDTWQYDGNTWTQVLTGGGPVPPLSLTAMTYNPECAGTLLFGGNEAYQGSPAYHDELWLYSGGAWSLVTPTSIAAPVARSRPRMVYDAARQKTILIGGESYFNAIGDEVWEFDCTTMAWTERTAHPWLFAYGSGYCGHTRRCVFYDEAAARVYIHDDKNDLAWWSGGAYWNTTPINFGGVGTHSMSYDPRMSRALRIAGVGGGFFVQEWTGEAAADPYWRTASPPLGSAFNGYPELVWDADRGRAIIIATSFAGVQVNHVTEFWTRGNACTSDAQCDTGHCTDGVCCETAACGTCESCNQASSLGVCTGVVSAEDDTCNGVNTCDQLSACRLKLAQACTLDNQCQNGFCVDGYCCDRECAGGCAACNGGDRGWSAFNGYCAAAPAGATIEKCALLCTGSEACATCFADADCGPSEYCNAGGACTARRPLGIACDATTECKVPGCRICTSGFCADGFCCTSSCGTCASCDLAGQEGQCVVDPTGVEGRACSVNGDCCSAERCIQGGCRAGTPPVFTSTGATSTVIFAPYRYDDDARVSTSGSAPIRYSIVASESASIDPLTGQIYVVPIRTGTMTLQVRADNPWGHAVQSLNVMVTSDGRPAIVRDASSTAIVGRPYLLNDIGVLRATGAQPLVFTKLDGPAALYVTPQGVVTFRPPSAGSFQVSIAAQNALGTDVYPFRIDVSPPPIAAPPHAVLSATPIEGVAPLHVTFDSSASTADTGASILGRLLVFGDGSAPSTDLSGAHDYAPGAYVARLVVLDSIGQASSTSVGVRVGTGGALPPLVRIVADVTAGKSPLTVRFSCDCSLDQNTHLRWTFGDGERSNDPAPVHTYASAGGYPVTLEAFVDGADAFARDQLDVRVSDAERQPPEVVAYATPVTGDAPLPVALHALVRDIDGAHTNITWSVDGVRIGETEDAQHVFDRPGSYEVTAQAIDEDQLVTKQVILVEVTQAGHSVPEILSLPNLRAFVGAPYSYGDERRPLARGDKPISWRLGKRVDGVMTNAPKGMTIDASTGVIAWTPSVDQVGSVPVTVVAENGASADAQDFVVEVVNQASGCGCELGAREVPSRRGTALALVFVALLGFSRRWRAALALAILVTAVGCSPAPSDTPPVARHDSAILSGYGVINMMWPSPPLPPDNHRPITSEYSAMFYDSVRAKLILLSQGIVSGSQQAVTWAWDGTEFDYVNTSFFAARQCRVTFDTSRGVGVAIDLFGVMREFNGTTWTVVTPATAPTADLSTGCISFLPAINRTIFFGGYYYDLNLGDYVVSNETWAWDGTDWTRLFPMNSPPERYNFAMALHGGQGVLYAGMGNSSHISPGDHYLSDVWTFDGVDWTPQPMLIGFPQDTPTFVYDSGRDRLQLIGDEERTGPNGYPDTSRLKVKELHPMGWGWVPTAVGGFIRENFAAGYDPIARRTYIYGGTTSFGGAPLFDNMLEYYTRGETCTLDAQCTTGHCVDGFCCTTSACGLCESCDFPNNEGICTPVQDFAPDPDTCPFPQTCNATTMTCRGAGNIGTPCTTSAECALGFCVDGVCCDRACDGACEACDAISRGWYDGPQGQGYAMSYGIIDGMCMSNPDVPLEDPLCGGFLCWNAYTPGSCRTLCLDDTQCVSTHYCAPDGKCKPRKVDGAFCDTTTDCKVAGCRTCSSDHCIDGVCCATDCTAECQACNVAGSLGSCVDVPLGGYDRRGLCPASPSGSCATDGTCNGAGACRQRAVGTVCAVGACMGESTLLSSAVCDGAGSCGTQTSQSCGNYVCAAAACKTTCTTSDDCITGSSCIAGACTSSCVTQCAATAECCSGQRCIFGECKSGGLPSIISTPSPTGSLYAPYQYNVGTQNRVVATGQGPITFALDPPTPGATIDPVSGSLFYIPTVAGEHDLVVTASNAWGAATQHVRFTALDGGAPSFLENANGTAVVGRPYAINASNALVASGARPMAFALAEGPAELHVQGESGRVDWIPTTAGVFSVRVRAENGYGSDQYAFLVNVSATPTQPPPSPVAAALPRTGDAPLDVLFTDRSIAGVPGSIVTRQWLFGDDTAPSFEPIAPHRYLAGGAYVARLLVLDNLGQPATAAIGVQVSSGGVVPPLATIAALPTEGAAPLTVRFSCDCDRAQGARLTWNFGDGETSVENAPVHVYTRPGSYHASLEALDEASGARGVDRLEIRALDGIKQPPRVVAFADRTAGDAPLSVSFKSQVADLDGTITGYQWRLAGTELSSTSTAEHTFAEAGIYRVELLVTDSDGLTGVDAVEVRAGKGGAVPPVFVSQPRKNGTTGQPYVYGDTPSPVVRGDRPLTFTVGKMVGGVEVGHPEGMTINPSTGAIAWTPSGGQVGAIEVSLVVSNAGGATSQDFVVTVAPALATHGCAYALDAAAPRVDLVLLFLGFVAFLAGRLLIRSKADEARHATRRGT